MPERPTIRQILESGCDWVSLKVMSMAIGSDRKIVEHQPRLQKLNIGNDSEKMHKMIIGGRLIETVAVAEEARHIVAEDREHSDN